MKLLKKRNKKVAEPAPIVVTEPAVELAKEKSKIFELKKRFVRRIAAVSDLHVLS